MPVRAENSSSSTLIDPEEWKPPALNRGKGVTWRGVSAALLVIALLTLIVVPLLTEALGRTQALVVSVGLFFTALIIIERLDRRT